MTNAIDSAVQGSVRPSLEITWADEDGVSMNLTNATVTGTIRANATGAVRAIAGDITVTDAEAGVFRWDLDAADVATAGQFRVQFEATYSVGQTPARSVPAAWRVVASQTAEV